jgi:thiamine-phosphate pyrophosphorylase
VRGLLPEALIGVSTHDIPQLIAAADLPVDYRAIGPIFPTTTKRNPDPVVGLQTLRRARASIAGPLVAIGGVRRDNAADILKAGADGLAVISDLFGAPDLGAAVREYRDILRAASDGL